MRWAAAIASGLLLAASFPPLDLGWLAWVALVPVLVAGADLGPGAAFTTGWVTGAVAYGLDTSWFVTTLVRFTALDRPEAVAAHLAAVSVLAVYPGLFLLVVERARGGVWVPVVAWVATEWLRGWFFIGMPWARLGTTQHETLVVAQLAELGGVPLVSALIVATNAVVARWLQGARPVRATGVLALALAATWAWGTARLGALSESVAKESLRVAVVPGKVDQRQKWDPGYGSRILDRYVGLTRQAMAQRPDLVVWPETALPFAFEQSAGRRARIERLVREFRVPLLLGTIASERRRGRRLRRNRVYALAADGTVSGTYDKQVLVPFGEYVPLGQVMPFVHPIVGGHVPIVAGEGQAPLAVGPARIGVLICYESLLPGLARRHAAAGATLLAVLSNDGWYAGTAAPAQLAASAVFRAIETRQPLVRVANDGPSMLVDAAGRVVWRADDSGAPWHVVEVPPRGQAVSPHGEALVIVVCVLATIAALVRPGRLGLDDA